MMMNKNMGEDGNAAVILYEADSKTVADDPVILSFSFPRLFQNI